MRRRTRRSRAATRPRPWRQAMSRRGRTAVRRTAGSAYTLLTDAPQGDVLPQPDAVAVAHLPLLLQVLRLRHARRAPVLARGSGRDPRRRLPAARRGAARAHGGAPRRQRRGTRAPALLRPRG